MQDINRYSTRRTFEYQNNEDLNEFKRKMQQETKNISQKSKITIDLMDLNQLLEKINKNNIVYRIVMTPNHARKHAWGCMDLMDHMKSIEEKYMACRFFHLVETGAQQWPQLKLFAKAFFNKSESTKTLTTTKN
ncbi:hypothetical protein [Desulfoplanes formicivorans]|uniref:Uncharacterized protein n=1 Tax=Desulfoplanes formicivorans TaxID=1592317 RepID=A0A194AES4_9BACT|nr:hypothetical protein [Desulfoplanes formicivorans]GAU07601.1 hypothetical protein DPF_0291 [Desulfoplanes formicivorans]